MTDKPADPMSLPPPKPAAPSIRRPPVELKPRDLARRIKRGRARIVLAKD